MKQGRSLPEVLTELQRQNAAKQDYIGAAEALPSASETTTASAQRSFFIVRWHRR